MQYHCKWSHETSCKWEHFTFYFWLILLSIMSSGLIVVINGRISFFFMAEYHHIFFIHSSVHGHLGCSISWLLWLMLQWTWRYRYFFKIMILFLLNIYPEVRLLDYLVVLFFVFFRNLHTFFHNSWNSLYSYQQCTKIPFIPYPYQHL